MAERNAESFIVNDRRLPFKKNNVPEVSGLERVLAAGRPVLPGGEAVALEVPFHDKDLLVRQIYAFFRRMQAMGQNSEIMINFAYSGGMCAGGCE